MQKYVTLFKNVGFYIETNFKTADFFDTYRPYNKANNALLSMVGFQIVHQKSSISPQITNERCSKNSLIKKSSIHPK